MKGNPAVPGGPLTSKPTWPNTREEYSVHVGFLFWVAADSRHRQGMNEPLQVNLPSTELEIKIVLPIAFRGSVLNAIFHCV